MYVTFDELWFTLRATINGRFMVLVDKGYKSPKASISVTDKRYGFYIEPTTKFSDKEVPIETVPAEILEIIRKIAEPDTMRRVEYSCRPAWTWGTIVDSTQLSDKNWANLFDDFDLRIWWGTKIKYHRDGSGEYWEYHSSYIDRPVHLRFTDDGSVAYITEMYHTDTEMLIDPSLRKPVVLYKIIERDWWVSIMQFAGAPVQLKDHDLFYKDAKIDV